MVSRALTVMMICLFGFARIAQEKPKDDALLVQGSWIWDPAAKQSDAKPVILLEQVTIKDDSLTFHYSIGGKKFNTATKFKLDATTAPKQIDFTPSDKDNENVGKPHIGLYEFKAGRLMICYRGPGSSRPKSFLDKSDGNDLTVFIVLIPSPSA